MVRVSLIGAGYLGRFHALNLKEIEDVNFKGIYDIDLEKAKTLAKETETRVFHNLDESISEADAVIIATTTSSHYEIALRCLQAGRDVFIEKPITATVNEAETLVAEAERTGRLIQVGHLERYNPAIQKAEKMLKEPIFYEAVRLSPFQGRGTDVDITLDLMIHDIDIVLAISGSRVKELKAVGAKVLTENVDVAKAWLVLDNGAQACLTAGRLSPEKRRILRIFQDTAMLEVDYQKPLLRVYGRENSSVTKKEFNFPPPNPIREELKDFIRSVKERTTPRIDASQALEAIKVAMEISRILRQYRRSE